MDPNSNNVLIVDDEANQRGALASMASGWGFKAETAADGLEALEKLKAFHADVIVTDLMMPGMDGMELLRQLSAAGGAPPIIVLTAFGNIETAIATVHDLGAFWFMEKPVQPRALRWLLERAAAQRGLQKHTELLERQLSSQGVLVDMVGASPAMQEVFSLIRQAAPTRATILVTGESGTGKELVARAVHQLSPRRSGPFIAINCAALPESLIESELFGHEKGAFTGALERRAGSFELAQHGTLLLDEIGEMPVSTQAKLLRVLEDRRVRRLGSPREVDIDVRVLASTNRPLEDGIKRGAFREDLYFRLNVFQIHLPALRERLSDIPLLTDSMLKNLNEKHGCKVTDVDPAVFETFSRYSWNGNVRELRNVLERAVILAGEGTLTVAHLPKALTGAPVEEEVREDGGGLPCAVLRVGTTIDRAERALIELTLKHTNNNRTRAAAILGISQKTLFNKLKEYGASAPAG